MDLRTWCKEHGVSMSEVQRRAGVAYTTVLAAADGRLSRYDIAVVISEVTEGAVSPETLCAKTAREALDNFHGTGTDGT